MFSSQVSTKLLIQVEVHVYECMICLIFLLIGSRFLFFSFIFVMCAVIVLNITLI
jgi:hypothetical protein